MELSNYIQLLSGLAQESRLMIFRTLVEAGPQGLNPTLIAERLEMAPATLSFHLKELHRAGLLHRKKQGRSLLYSANFETMQSLIDYLLENCCGGLNGCAEGEER